MTVAPACILLCHDRHVLAPREAVIVVGQDVLEQDAVHGCRIFRCLACCSARSVMTCENGRKGGAGLGYALIFCFVVEDLVQLLVAGSRKSDPRCRCT